MNNTISRNKAKAFLAHYQRLCTEYGCQMAYDHGLPAYEVVILEIPRFGYCSLQNDSTDEYFIYPGAYDDWIAIIPVKEIDP